MLKTSKISGPAYDIRISPNVFESFAEIIKGKPPLFSSSKDLIFLRILSSFLNPLLSFLSWNYFNTTN
jgi:hypothetical protein